MTLSPIVFDARAVRRHRARGAWLGGAEFLFDEVAQRLVERLDHVRRDFAEVLELGARGGALGRLVAGRAGTARVTAIDEVAGLLPGAGPRLVASPELLPFRDAAFDLVLSCLALHWVNDLPGALAQLRRALTPDGLFLGALFGGETLRELGAALIEAELAETGGASPRVSPMADLRDMAGLLQRAGFAMPVADLDTIEVTYPDALALMRDLRAMGETNALVERSRAFTRRATLFGAAARYAERHAAAGGRIRATFQVIFLAGWAPHPAQPKPLRPGSAARRLADALGAEERKAGDKTAPDPTGA